MNIKYTVQKNLLFRMFRDFAFNMVCLPTLFLMCSNMAQAACTINDSSPTFDLPGSVTIPRGAVPGEVITERTVALSGTCVASEGNPPGNIDVFNSPSNPAWTPGGIENTVIDTTSGIGLLLEFTTENGVSWPSAGALNDPNLRSARLNAGTQPTPFTLNARARYIVADPAKVNNNPLKALTVTFTQSESSQANGTGQPFFSLNLPPVNVIRETCSVTTPDIQIDMGRINTDVFTGPGSVAGDKPFNIELMCDSRADIAVRFRGAMVGVQKDILALSSGSEASGIGVQFLYNSVPVPFDDTPVTLTTPTDLGAYTIPLIARFIQTEAKIVPGVATATSSFEIIYL